MKKKLLFALAVIAVGCTEPIPRNVDELVQQGDTYLDRETMRGYTGPIFEFFPDDTTRIRSTGTLKDGEWNGQISEYFENGQLMEKGTLVDGVAQGPYASYHENGQLEEKTTFEDGMKNGPFELYFENGQLSWKGTYKNGERDGPYEGYWDNGQLAARSSYKNGIEEGVYYFYHDNGQLLGRGYLLGGKAVGLSERYWENGQLREKGTDNMGEKCGEWLQNGESVTYDPCPPEIESLSVQMDSIYGEPSTVIDDFIRALDSIAGN